MFWPFKITVNIRQNVIQTLSTVEPFLAPRFFLNGLGLICRNGKSRSFQFANENVIDSTLTRRSACVAKYQHESGEKLTQTIATAPASNSEEMQTAVQTVRRRISLVEDTKSSSVVNFDVGRD